MPKNRHALKFCIIIHVIHMKITLPVGTCEYGTDGDESVVVGSEIHHIGL